MASEKERSGTGTGKHVHVLCFQRHTEMLANLLSESAQGVLHACREPGCPARYDSSRGYFIDGNSVENTEREITPRVTCSVDGQPMYLAEVMPERKSFRLWKCPECNETRTNEETSGGLEKKWERKLYVSLSAQIVKTSGLSRLVRLCPQLHPSGQFQTYSKPSLGHALAVDEPRL